MKGNATVLKTLNGLLTHEMTAADQYFIHSRMYQNWGLNELYERMSHEQGEELGHAARIVERVLFLEGTPDVSKRDKLNIGKDVPTMIKNDLAYEKFVQKELAKAIAVCEKAGDYISRSTLVGLQSDTEEDHIYWLEVQQRLIEQMGLANYIQSKASSAE